jgi:uncharacterized protein
MMMATIAAFLIGLMFGLGLIVSQMVNPAKVLSFLDLAGHWDPSLAFVMASAVVVSAIGALVAKRRRAPVFARTFAWPERTDVNPRLLSGAALFGIGWGLVGLCPGPAVTGLSMGLWQVWVFVVAMIAGMVFVRAFDATTSPGENAEEDAR